MSYKETWFALYKQDIANKIKFAYTATFSNWAGALQDIWGICLDLMLTAVQKKENRGNRVDHMCCF